MRRISGRTSGIHLCKMELGILGEQPKMHLTVGRSLGKDHVDIRDAELGQSSPGDKPGEGKFRLMSGKN